MKTPICIISYNRSLYLNSLLHSLEDELDHFDIVVCDNGSTESNMKNVFELWKNKVKFIHLSGGDWINDEYKAKNALLRHINSHNKTENSVFLQDDLQYVGPRGFLKNIIDDLSSCDFLNTSLSAVRKSTLRNICSDIKTDHVWSIANNHFNTTGLYQNKVFFNLGLYCDNFPTQKEFWGKGEDDYDSRVSQKYGPSAKISATSHVPVFVGIWNDPRGSYSFIRDNKRYGMYLPPAEGHKIYYEHMSFDNYEQLKKNEFANSFVDVANPLGWSYAMDDSGDQKKYPQSLIMSEGPASPII
jgi:glycosyltransferase involved in cell wall biosynthesis